MSKFHLKSIVVLSLILHLVAGPSFAEEPGISTYAAQPPATLVLIPGALASIETYGPIGYRRLCAPRSIGLIEWQVGFIERLLRLRDEQKDSLSGLVTASAKAREAIASSCPKEAIRTTSAVLAVMERRVTGLLEALKIIRPPYEGFYASLDDHQKRLLDALGPSRRGWRW